MELDAYVYKYRSPAISSPHWNFTVYGSPRREKHRAALKVRTGPAAEGLCRDFQRLLST